MLQKTREQTASRSGLAQALAGVTGTAVDRRTFLRRSGLAAGGAALLATGSLGVARPAEAATAPAAAAPKTEIKKTLCSHCSVGCTVVAEVENGVWVRQQPAYDSPINVGGHCAKGAAVREHAHGEKRVKYPMKLVGGKWKRISWDDAINEVSAKILDIRQKSGPDSVYWLGTAKFSNEQAYLMRKFGAFWGSNNIDHQARICHSTTVAGVGQTWGYGAMTNSYNDIYNSKLIFMIGSNAAEAHPVSMMHILRAKEINNAPLIVCDPRFTRTAAHATEHVRLRSGTDIPFIYGIMWHIFENGWEDKEFLKKRVWGLTQIREEVKKWTPAEVENVTGVPPAQVKRVARLLTEHKPGTMVWCMGGTQHHIGSSNTRIYCILQLVLGNMGVAGGGTNIFRGHDNVQGASDMGLDVASLPGYYGIAEPAWKHWARVWDVSYDYLLSRFPDKKMMEAPGIPLSRWFDGVLETKENLAQPDNIKAMMYWGVSPNSQTRLPDMKKAMEKLELLVFVDPFPTVGSVMHDRTDGVYILPAATQYEAYGSRTASNRSVQWGEQIVKPLFESKLDHEIMYRFAQKFGFANEMFKHIRVDNNVPSIEDILREMNKGLISIGMTGHSPERLKAHLANQHTFDPITLRANGGPCDGDYYGLPWPCWGNDKIKHPGSPNLYDPSKSVMDGGMGFRASFGVERNGENLLAEDTWPKGSEVKGGYPQLSYGFLKKMGWDHELTEQERATIEQIGGEKADEVGYAVDLSGGIVRVGLKHGLAPTGNAKARCVVWNFPDQIPIHREPLYAVRRDLVAKYPTFEDGKGFRLPMLYKSVQQKDYSKQFPIMLTTGRIVEYEGGGEETRSNPWLAELLQDMYCEVNPRDANNAGIRPGEMMWVLSPEGAKIKVKARVTEGVMPGQVYMPFNFAGHWMGKSLQDKYPEGTAPYVLGESANTAMTYGYDPVTCMQETKITLCRIEKA